MKKTTILFTLILFSFGLNAQNCFDFVQNHFDNVENLCGYHGGLHFKIQETDSFDEDLTTSIDIFVDKWLQEKYNDGAVNFAFWRNEESEISPNVIRYNFSYYDYVLDEMVMLLRFDDDGALRSYNVSCPKNLKFILKKIVAIDANAFDPGINKTKIISSVKNVKYIEESLLITKTIKYYNDADESSKMIIDLVEQIIIYDSNSDFAKKKSKNQRSKAPNNPCDGNEDGIVGVSIPTHSYPMADQCIVGTSGPDIIAFLNNHNYLSLSNAQIGPTFDTDLRILCDSQLRYIDHIPNWIECVFNDVDYKHGDNKFIFCSDPVSGTDDLGKFEYTMSYYHLAQFFQYLDGEIISNTDYDFVNMPYDQILFNPYNTDIATIYTVTFDNNEISTINYAAGVDSGYIPLAQDANYIVVGGLHAYWDNILPDNPTVFGSVDGLFYGAMDYIVWRYSSSTLGAASTNLYSWGGDTQQFERSVNLSLTYQDMLNNSNFDSPQKKGQVFSGSLHQIQQQVSPEIADFLIFKTLPFMLDGNDQPEAAQMLYDAAETEHLEDNSANVDISAAQLCKIGKILKNRYSSLVTTVTYDFYVRDSYEGQPSGGNIQNEDIGDEPNGITYDFAKCPDIWNKVNAGSTNPNDTSHDNPKYNNGALNYLYVDIRNRGCAELDPAATVHVYLRESHSSSIWSIGWTAGWYTGMPPNDPYNPPPDNPLVGYEITSSPNDVFVPMGIPVTDYILNYTDSEGRDVYRYEIPWVPFNPLALPEHSQWGASAWGCLLVRIVSDLDPMPANEEGNNAWDNNVKSNNIAIRNTSIKHVAGNPVAPPGEPGEPDVSGWNIVSAGDNDADDDEINVHDITFTINSDIEFNDNEDVFDYVQIEFILTPNFLNAWKNGGTQGTDFEWIDHQRIRITGPNFALKNVPLQEEMPHRVFCSVSQKRSFENVQFYLTMLDDKGCPMGAQEFIVLGDSELAIKNNTNEQIVKRSAKEEFEIIPNPMNSQAKITGESIENITSFIVYNSLGEKVKVPSGFSEKNGININMSNQKPGIYFVTLIMEDKLIKVLKFIKL